MKCKNLLYVLLCCSPFLNAQIKHEREHRIRKDQFPETAKTLIAEEVQDAKKIKYYKEIDGDRTKYEVKLKKDKLWYSIEFNKDGVLEDIEITVKPIDLPDESYTAITNYLGRNFNKYKIQKIQQQYLADQNDVKATFKKAFQNLILPEVNYELMINGKEDKRYELFEMLFNAEGKFIKKRTALPPNYDHILY